MENQQKAKSFDSKSAIAIVAILLILIILAHYSQNMASTSKSISITYTTTLPSTTVIQSTITQNTTTIPSTTSLNITTIASTTSTNYLNCANFTLSLSNPNTTTSDSCYWSGGNLSVLYNLGKFSSMYTNITSPYGFEIQSPLFNSYPNSTICTYNNQTYNLSSGTYDILLSTGSYGSSCTSGNAYIKLG